MVYIILQDIVLMVVKMICWAVAVNCLKKQDSQCNTKFKDGCQRRTQYMIV